MRASNFKKRKTSTLLPFVLVTLVVNAASHDVSADPCGMVPPIYPGQNVPIARVGIQKTYVFFKDGIETFVIRPGYSGRVDEFGMLIPFPNPPALRKVSDDVFPHIAAAIDPPEVVVDLTPHDRFWAARVNVTASAAPTSEDGSLAFHEVRVLNQEAVGMYEVAVLEAGSAEALNRWMSDHGFRYPQGMDDVCEEYVEQGWCFVAVKTRVGQKGKIDPKPGMREVNSELPPNATFDGKVQAMGFRFRTDELVVPMRLSAFNEGDLRNVVYLLTDGPQSANSISPACVVRQISGEELFRNVTQLLPLRIIGGDYADIPESRRQGLASERNPIPHNGIARDLFAADLLAVRKAQLSHPHEETEKMLLRIGERLAMRGPDLDKLHEAAVQTQRDQIAEEALAGLSSMTLTIIDGDFPREVIARQNITFTSYEMDRAKNLATVYEATTFGPAASRAGQRVVEQVRITKEHGTLILENHPGWLRQILWKVLATLVIVAVLGAIAYKLRSRRGVGGAAILLIGLILGSSSLAAQDEQAIRDRIPQLADSKTTEQATQALVRYGTTAVPLLVAEASDGTDLVRRGWAIVCLAEIGGAEVDEQLHRIHDDAGQPSLIRTWALAGRIKIADSQEDLFRLALPASAFPAAARPLGIRLAAKSLSGQQPTDAGGLLGVVQTVPSLQQSLAPAILALGKAPLIRTMTSANDQNVRRQATAYLGTLALQGDRSVAAAVIDAYRFDSQATTLPWHGGPLFIPSLQWNQPESRELVGHLISWLLWCDLQGKHAVRQPIINNFSSVQLMQVAGYQWPTEASLYGWLQSWGHVVGRSGLQKLLAEQGVANQTRFLPVLDGLR